MRQTIFTIAPGAPFLRTFVEAFLDGHVVAGFSRALGPLALADATIYVPTRRAARALIDEFARALGAPSTLLPEILPLGALEATEASLIFEEAADFGRPLELPQAAGEIMRRMRLAELILAWARALRHAIVRVGPDGPEVDGAEAILVAATPADAFSLSGDLAELIDELIIENVDWERLDPLALPEFDPFWRITLNFLDIAVREWPKILQAQGFVDRARRQAELIEKQSARLCAGRLKGPVVAIGSTGSNAATARLLAAIAAAPQGAVVLPGLDLHLDDASFAMIAGDGEAEAVATHPQAALSRLLRSLNVARADVLPLGAAPPVLALRERFLSEALRPAESTDKWISYRASLDAAAFDAALAGVALIEAADEREEALALAIAMRETLEREGETAALVTPDRELARRVGAELRRWGVVVEDSGGEPLSSSPAGVLARLAEACAASGLDGARLSALLAHPRARLGFSRAEAARLATLLEIGVLRAGLDGPLLLDAPEAVARARAAAAGRCVHPAQQRIAPADWAQLGVLLARLGAALKPLLELEGAQRFDAWTKAHRDALAAILAGEDAPAQGKGAPAQGEGVAEDFGEDFDALDALFDELAASATENMRFDSESYGVFFAAVAGEARLRGPGRAHPRLKILGLLEARLMEADVMLLGGLDEAVWPPQARADAFLNRPMRSALGLTPPERKLGQTAHDFAQAMGRGRIVLSRAVKRGGTPTVASRFLQRLAALGGTTWERCALRGGRYVELARLIDRPAAPAALLKRPAPAPPLDLRPQQLSVTRIETLRRDPYALYAEMILKLLPLDPIGRAFGPAETGGAIHAALERLARAHPAGPLPPCARSELIAHLREELAENFEDPDFVAFDWPRLEATVDFLLNFEAGRREPLREIRAEVSGKLEMRLADGSSFVLTARADRIEVGRDKSLVLVDYKTGEPPGTEEIRVGFAPQLTLEAAMACRGAFDPDFAGRAVSALYVKLGGAGGGRLKSVEFKGEAFMDVAEDHFAGFLRLIEQFRDPATPYPPRPFPKFAKAYNAYDHLARTREWSLGGESEAS